MNIKMAHTTPMMAFITPIFLVKESLLPFTEVSNYSHKYEPDYACNSENLYIRNITQMENDPARRGMPVGGPAPEAAHRGHEGETRAYPTARVVKTKIIFLRIK